MTHRIKVVTYEHNVGSYRSFDSTTIEDATEAIASAKALAKRTGKCYGVFSDEGKIHDTSSYYAQFNLAELP